MVACTFSVSVVLKNGLSVKTHAPSVRFALIKSSDSLKQIVKERRRREMMEQAVRRLRIGINLLIFMTMAPYRDFSVSINVDS
jgi:hypothetical protein